MEPAPSLQWILKDEPAGHYAACWQAYDPESKVDLGATCLCIGRRLYFVDPVPLAEEALASLCAVGEPAGILLTNGNHERAAAAYRERFHIPVGAHVGAAPELTLPVDHLFGDGTLLFGELAAIALPGGGAGETAFYWEALGGVLVLGDALIHLPQTGLCHLPEKYCADAALLRHSLGKLLPFQVQTAFFAHGGPITPRAAEVLAPLLQA